MASEKVAEEAAQPPKRKKFTIPLEEAPPLEVKSLFKSSRSLPSPITSVHEAPLNYADYTTSRLFPGRIRAEATLQGARPEAAQPGAQPKGAAQGAWPEAAQPGTQPKGASQRARPEVDQPGAQPKAAPQGAGSEAAPSLGQPGGEIANQGPQGSRPQTKSSSITVSPRQRGNPVLKFIRNVPWEFGEIVPDYVMGQSTCALFLSLRYHNLHPNYIHERLQGLGKNYALRVLLLQIDVKDPQRALKDLAKMCILADCTLILAWSPEEAGRYLETYKSYEQKPADLLKEKLEQDFVSRVTECLTTVKSVNKTDSQTLLATFGSLEQLTAASQDDLSLCPGFGPQKARRLFEVLHQPFLKVP
ncbi:DNA excision repair protein ERCC-1 [Notamacropus eugenii]|uniref:DNA excision repair protein ERCC-1 n=1 Tax=Notamacropus eugenii TaxID=9315 RepID=UPI003B670EC2